jgi:cyclic pyranopterin phosphate synthase
MEDGFGRTIDYLRVSVTDRCNLRCAYCMPPEGIEWVPHAEVLSFEETLRVCSAAASLGISRVKVTGGEPLVRRGLHGFISALKRTSGISAVSLTTNGLLLGGALGSLIEAGLDAVNISLDTLREPVFRRLTGSDGFREVMRSVEAALSVSAGQAASGRASSARPLSVKINCVSIRGVNEEDIVPLALLARDNRVCVRFIELMPLGLGASLCPVPETEVFARLSEALGGLKEAEGNRLGNGPAVYYEAPGFAGKIGFISALTHRFCPSCNRIRLTGTGLLKPCLASAESVDIKKIMRGGGSGFELAEAFREAVRRKPARHDFGADESSGSAHTGKRMYSIGG